MVPGSPSHPLDGPPSASLIALGLLVVTNATLGAAFDRPCDKEFEGVVRGRIAKSVVDRIRSSLQRARTQGIAPREVADLFLDAAARVRENGELAKGLLVDRTFAEGRDQRGERSSELRLGGHPTLPSYALLGR